MILLSSEAVEDACRPEAIFWAELLNDAISVRDCFTLSEICWVHVHRRQNLRSLAALGNDVVTKYQNLSAGIPKE